jgi:hypothetical protein
MFDNKKYRHRLVSPYITILWREFMTLWKMRNDALHGHRQLCIEMELLHQQRDLVLACNADIFIGETMADLTHFLDASKASHIQNWLHVWKPFILSSAKSAKDLSLKGVSTITKYVTPSSAIPHRPLSARAHRTACPRIRPCRDLPQPSYRFRSLCSFFGLHTWPLPH